MVQYGAPGAAIAQSSGLWPSQREVPGSSPGIVTGWVKRHTPSKTLVGMRAAHQSNS